MASYDQKAIEKKWQQQWQDRGIYHFDFESDKKPYSIDVPPRYASGPLHAGHAVHYTHIDFAARYKRMRDYNVFFPLCFDVNGIPIEERVERQMKITRKDIDRHKFTKICSEFAEKNISTMIDQFIRLGHSMDPTIYYQTNAEYYRRITQISFISLYHKGLIYKGKFPVNWCPRCMTAMADAEVAYTDRTTKLNTIKFYFVDKQSEQLLKYHSIGKDDHGVYVEIATTRPEMLPSCQIVAVHPNDERAPWLVDQTLVVPMFNKKVKIVADDAVDPDFGSGVVMICTVGDKEDLNWVFKYKLPIEMSIDEEGRMTEICGQYQGMRIEEARAAVINDLGSNNLLLKQAPLEQNVGACWRCKTPVEFINAEQWFLKTTDFKDLVLKASDDINWFPKFMKIRLEDWVNSLEWDWVISRQRYFATPIPLWECEHCNEVVVARPEDCYIDPTINKPPVDTCPKCGGALKGCEDVFDTWMDSSISPLYNTFWHRDDTKFNQLYPMSLRPQSHDIIRTWAFYTILRCTLITEQPPFETIMMGGFILSEDGTPMHASLGNVIDPYVVIDEYGTDAFRCYAASCALGEDNPFRKKDIIRGSKLLRKLWNVQQFIANINKDTKPTETPPQGIDQWILTKYSTLVQSCTEQMEIFDYSQAMKDVEYFLWHEFADHYIEMIKASVYEKQSTTSIPYTLYTIGLGILKLFAPIYPHITEELYQIIYKPHETIESIHLSSWPEPIYQDHIQEHSGEIIKNYISLTRNWKSEQGIALNAPLKVHATYAPQEDIAHLKAHKNIIISTLNYPKTHKFLPGKPAIEEKIQKIDPNYATIGPRFKQQSKTIITWIQQNQDHLKTLLEKQDDITWKDIPPAKLTDTEPLIKNNYLRIQKTLGLKGDQHTAIIKLDKYYLDIEEE
jgi:valyl-tRNA synthetase